MRVTNASVRIPAASPIDTSARASASASSTVFMNAPRPALTSSTSASLPSAIFLLMTDAQMSGRLSMVAVTSRRAYSFLSAGATSAVWLMMAHPTSRSVVRNWSSDSAVRNPGIASSLSSVPPVWPSPRPDIFGTITPQAATSGARTIETLSPTPPVLCLPTLMPGSPERSTRRPESAIARVRSAVSRAPMPFRTIAISSAEAW